MVKGQLGAGGLWTGGVKHLLAWSFASPLLPESASHFPCGGFSRSNMENAPPSAQHTLQQNLQDKALPRSRFWPNLPALAGWKEGASKRMNTGGEQRVISAPAALSSWVGSASNSGTGLCTTPILLGKRERELENRGKKGLLVQFGEACLQERLLQLGCCLPVLPLLGLTPRAATREGQQKQQLSMANNRAA